MIYEVQQLMGSVCGVAEIFTSRGHENIFFFKVSELFKYFNSHYLILHRIKEVRQ